MVALTLTFLASYHPLLIPVEPALAAGVCAIPGKDGVVNQSTIVNTYFPGAPDSSATAGSTSLSVSNYYTSGANTPIAPGDLLMVIQMQDATIDFTNSLAYGSGNIAGGGSGQTALGASGQYEFVYAQNSVPLSGGTLQIRGGGAGGGLVNTYVNANPTSTRGRRTFQVIRVQQYASLTLASNITVPDWNGTVGGVLVFDVAGDMNFNSFTIDGTNKGFRGGYTPSGASGQNVTTYVASAGSTVGGGKGEGIAGTPRYMWDGITAVNLGSDQLPGGDAGRGAPSNGGGGGNDHNSGGAGGGNGGRGGTGGIGWQGAGGSTGLPGGQGIGGFPVSNPATIDRLIMGGGGGGGDANDQPNGVRGGQGGGIVLIRAGRFVGSGTIRSNGSDGEINQFNNNPDGAGGGGAGGTIALQALHGNLSGLTVEAKGGNGGNTLNDNGNEHGPGGGGGGGVVVSYSPGGTVSGANLTGGANGRANNGAGIPHGATAGTVGVSATFAPTSLPPIEPGASCFPTLNVTKSEANPGGAGQRFAPSTATYTITVSNTGPGGAAGVQIVDPLPAGFSYASGATATFAGGALGSASPTNSGTATTPIFGDFLIPAGGNVTLTFTVNIAAGTPPGTYQNSAQVRYLDPTRTTANPNRLIAPATSALPGANTTYENGVLAGQSVPGSNYDAVTNTAEDVVIAAVPTSVSGTVFHDYSANVVLDSDLGTDVGTNADSPSLTVYAINPSSQVVDKAIVAANGTYTLANVPSNSSLTLRLSNDSSAAIGATVPNVSLPSNWYYTGENVNGTIDAVISTLGDIAITTTTSALTNQNFGIRQGYVIAPDPAPTTCNPDYTGALTTGISSTGGQLSPGNFDLNWSVEWLNASLGAIPYAPARPVGPMPAVVVGNLAPGAWINEPSNARWISYPFRLSNNSNGNHQNADLDGIVGEIATPGSYTGTSDTIRLKYTASVTLPANANAISVSLPIGVSVDNQFVSVRVNGVENLSPLPAQDPQTEDYRATRTVNMTQGWQPGVNIIEIITDSGSPLTGFFLRVEAATIQVCASPNVSVVKRITAINSQTSTQGGDNLSLYKDEASNPYDDNTITIPTQPNPTDPPKDTDKWPNLSTFLVGGTNGGFTKPGDELEYTIYFLSAGDGEAQNVLFCDRVPTNVTFNPTAFNTGVPADPNGISTANRGIVVNVGGNSLALTGVADGDRARYFPPGVEPSLVPEFSGINCNGANTNGAVVVNLGNLNSATAPGVPADSYGFVRFRARVK